MLNDGKSEAGEASPRINIECVLKEIYWDEIDVVVTHVQSEVAVMPSKQRREHTCKKYVTRYTSGMLTGFPLIYFSFRSFSFCSKIE